MIEAPRTVLTFAKHRPALQRGRGALSNNSGRFEILAKDSSIAAKDDGWAREEDPPLRTHVTLESPRTIITANQSPDIVFDQSINPYRGCEHGCVYCFARPTHAYMGLSAGLDFETRLFAKPNAAELLREELSSKQYQPKVIAIGTNTDPYQPIEKHHEITRDILKVLNEFNHPVLVVTKSHLVTRDIDILSEMAEKKLVKVALSITTLNRELSREMEPRASTPERRLSAIKKLSEAGIPTGVMVAPMIPALNEVELEAILERASKAGASQAGYIMLRLPLEIKHLFREWLETIIPNRANHIMNLVIDMRGGKENDATWHRRMKGQGPYAKLIADRFKKTCSRYGLNTKNRSRDLTLSLFRRPVEQDGQLTLL